MCELLQNCVFVWNSSREDISQFGNKLQIARSRNKKIHNTESVRCVNKQTNWLNSVARFDLVDYAGLSQSFSRWRADVIANAPPDIKRTKLSPTNGPHCVQSASGALHLVRVLVHRNRIGFAVDRF